jgi:hypothetical protein
MIDAKVNNLAEGDSLGHYQILRLLGAGGMGEGYFCMILNSVAQFGLLSKIMKFCSRFNQFFWQLAFKLQPIATLRMPKS